MRTILVLFFCSLLFSCMPSSATWVVYENEEFNYQVNLPEVPNVETRQINSTVGKVPSTMATAFEYSTPDRNNIFTVGCTQFPTDFAEAMDAATSKTIVDEIVLRLLNRFDGKLLYEKEMEVAGYPAKEFRIEFTNPKLEGVNHMTTRAFMKGNLQFMIQTISEKEQDAQPSIDKFMDSFEFVE